MCVHRNFYQRLKNELLHPTPLKMEMDCGRSWVRSSSPATFFRGVWSWNHFYGHYIPGADSSRAVVNLLPKRCAFGTGSRLGSLPRNSVVMLTDRLDMIIIVDWDVKQKIKLLTFFEMTPSFRGVSARNFAEKLLFLGLICMCFMFS